MNHLCRILSMTNNGDNDVFIIYKNIGDWVIAYSNVSRTNVHFY